MSRHSRSLFWAMLLWIGTLGAASADLETAMQAVRAKDWAGAAQAVRRDGQIARDIVEWHRLRAGKGRSDEVLTFLKRNPDWPGLPYLRKQSEPAFGNVSRAQVAAFFDGAAPQTAEGALVLASHLEDGGDSGSAQAEVVLAWRTLPMGSDVQADYLARYAQLLKPHHEARLDLALWKGWKQNARQMFPLVSEGWRALAEARIGLRDRVAGVDGLIAKVPETLQSDPGLAYERFQWRARKGRDDSAIDLLLERSRADTLGEPAYWSGWRRALARSQMRAGNPKTAYAIATDHGLVEGSAFADLEWLAGYLAVTYLNRPSDAVQHFLRFEGSVETPISLGRAGYWIGRAYEAMGDTSGAAVAYARGGAHQTSFYGLLAAERAGMAADESLRGREVFPDWRQAAFTQSSVHKAAKLLFEAGELSLAERFWVHLSETQDREALGQLGQMAQDIGAPHIAVMLGKKMVRRGVTLPGPYYPLHPLIKGPLPVPAEMALAIARRESEFDPVVVSHAGARGLMQLMPNTARQVSAAIGLPYSPGKLTSDAGYNAALGTAYLAGLSREFDGNVIMMSAGYNAGPSRPTRWMSERGDPRRGEIDMVDWIEHIPFNETRNYVMRVAESLPVYRARLGLDILPIPFSEELVGSTVPDLSP